MKFKDLASEVEKLKSSLAKRTIEVSRANFRRLVEYFGEMEMTDINEFTWNGYVLKCKAETPERRLFHDRKAMTTVMLFAFRQGHITRQVNLIIPDIPRDVGREISSEELASLFKAAGSELFFHMQIALRTGMRRTEMLALQWDRFDWMTCAIRLRPEDTKTRRGRVVPIPSVLLAEFKKRHRRKKSIYVFPSRDDRNKPITSIKTAWISCKLRAKVRARWNDFRHTCATVMLRLGASIGVVSKLLGMSEKVLSRIYRHINMDELRAASNVMNDYGARVRLRYGTSSARRIAKKFFVTAATFWQYRFGGINGQKS